MQDLHIYCCRIGDRYHNHEWDDIKEICWKCGHPMWVSKKSQNIAEQSRNVKYICLVCMNEWDDCKPARLIRIE